MGSTAAYGNTTPLQDVGSSTNQVSVNAALTGLILGVTYHCRCVASNSFGVLHGADKTFWTPTITLNSSDPLTSECHVAFVDPTTVSGSLLAIAAGNLHSLAVKADGTVTGWGINNYGQTTIPASATNVMAIGAGDFHSLALKADGTVTGWGWNYYGQTTIPASATNVVAIGAGDYHNLALKADGTIVSWGWNSYGQTTIPPGLNNLNLPIVLSGT